MAMQLKMVVKEEKPFYRASKHTTYFLCIELHNKYTGRYKINQVPVVWQSDKSDCL